MNQRIARALVFATSASVLIIEILAGRLMAPYLGVSLEVFTGIIGVILAGISIGAWLGGRAADRRDPTRLPGPLLVAGGATTLLGPPIIDLLGPGIGIDPITIVFLATAGFFVPAALLSAIPPVVVKIRLASLESTGSVVGSYSAIGTAGAIAGTFLTGFVLIAALPTRPIMAGLGLVLALAGAAMTISRSRWAAASIAVAAVLGSVWLALSNGPCEFETTYHCAEVRVDPVRTSGRILILDRAHNSYVDLEDPTYLDFRYARVMADVIATSFEPGSLEVLSIGGGGFTFPLYLDATRPGTSHTVLEIDRELVEIATSELGFRSEAEVIVADARQSIMDVPASSIDLVIGDAFSGLTVPWHLTTEEFVSTVAVKLKNSGIYLINVIDYGDLDFARSTVMTFQSVFDDVALFAPPEYLAGAAGGNFVVAGSMSQIDVEDALAAIRARNGSEEALTGDSLSGFAAGGIVLRDDYAPVDQMIDR